MIIKICPICGEEFQVPVYRKTAKYCSTKCQKISLQAKPNCICEVCGKEFHLKPSQLNKYKHHCCSRQCSDKLKSVLYKGQGNHQWGMKGPLNASFKGIEIEDVNNNLIDVKVYDPEHPYADKNGRVCKHRLIVEQNYKLFDYKYFELVNNRMVLKKTSHVHHINGNHCDNRIENLIPVTRAEHRSIHNAENIIIRNSANGKITGVLKQGELLESPEVDNQQPSLNSNVLEGSETSSRVLRDGNTTKSALPSNTGEDIVRTTDITNETVESQDKEPVR